MASRRSHRRGVGGAFALALAGVVVLCGPVAAADEGDPSEGNTRLDVERVSHATDSEFARYRVDTYDAFDDVRDFYSMRWDLDLDGDGAPHEACIILEQDGEGGLRASLYPGCGPEIWATTSATKPARDIVELRFPLRDLVQGAAVTPGRSFGYRVTAQDMHGGRDTAPDEGLVAQDGLPEPAKPEAPPAGESDAAGQDGQSSGEAPGVAEGDAPQDDIPLAERGGALGVGRRTDSSEPIGVGGSLGSWALALGVSGVVLAMTVLLVRRRRDDVAVDELEARDPWPPSHVTPVDRTAAPSSAEPFFTHPAAEPVTFHPETEERSVTVGSVQLTEADAWNTDTRVRFPFTVPVHDPDT